MKKLVLTALILNLFACIFAQQTTAKQISDSAVSKGSPQEAVQYLKEQVSKVSDPTEKRALYAFLGSVQESLALYTDAQNSYATAAGIAGGNAQGMPKKSSEQLVIDAIRCALSAGEYENAENYLNTAVRSSKSPEIQAKIKLYEQWASLCRAENASDLIEPAAMLKAYLELPSLESVQPSILLTLWYVTGESDYAERLKKKYPSSAEAGIVTGKVQIYPAPFWYFTPRKHIAAIQSVPEVQDAPAVSALAADSVKTPAAQANAAGTTAPAKENAKAATPVSSTEQTKSTAPKVPASIEKAKKQQLGLFREKANAQNFVNKLREKNFNGYIQEETRASGTVYYIVVVDENEAGTKADELRSAGFECYPLF